MKTTKKQQIHSHPKSSLTGKFCLVLNSAWFPVQMHSWQEAMTILCKGHAKALNTLDDFYLYTLDEWIQIHNKNQYEKHVNTVRLRIPVPEIIVLSYYDKLPYRKITFNRENLWIRDNGKCAYCLKELSIRDVTIDHVTPRALGGRTSFSNCVTACEECNHEKAHTPPTGKWEPKIKPREPNSHSLLYHVNKRLERHECDYPSSWDKFLIR